MPACLKNKSVFIPKLAQKSADNRIKRYHPALSGGAVGNRLKISEVTNMVQYKPVEPVSKTDLVLHSIGRKVASGADLSMPERLMAMTATAQVTANNYGPGPEDMVVQAPELPEMVKGVLANYTG